MIKHAILLLLITCLSACSLLQTKTETISVHWKGPQKFYFSGKGAGAGMALMSTMGPMGMAIGVAIDEGISKDIAKAQSKTGITIQQLLVSQAQEIDIEWLPEHSQLKSQLIIERIEFKLVRGGKNDATQVELKVTDTRGKNPKTIEYPKDFPDHQVLSFPLEQLKKDGEASNQLLKEAFQAILNKTI